MIKIIEIKPLLNYKLHLKYNDGVEGDIDLSDLAGKGVFEKFLDVTYFNSVKIGSFGEPSWNNELDIDPLNTYLTITGKSIEEYKKQVSN